MELGIEKPSSPQDQTLCNHRGCHSGGEKHFQVQTSAKSLVYEITVARKGTWIESASKRISSNVLMKISGDKLVSGEGLRACLNGTPSLLSLQWPSSCYFTLWLIRVFCGKRYLTVFLRYSNGTNGGIKGARRAEGPEEGKREHEEDTWVWESLSSNFTGVAWLSNLLIKVDVSESLWKNPLCTGGSSAYFTLLERMKHITTKGSKWLSL